MRSNTQLGSIRDVVRIEATQSFQFFATVVLGLQMEEDLCRAVQDVVEDREDYTFRTTRPKNLCSALHAWLVSQEVVVLSPVSFSEEHETLAWLDMTPERITSKSVAATLTLAETGVELKWL